MCAPNSHSLLRVYTPGNMLGDDAIAVLAGALKEMQNLEVLNLAGK